MHIFDEPQKPMNVVIKTNSASKMNVEKAPPTNQMEAETTL
ncbi:hypothetical protein KNP414_07119 [Paenibacillus mucilaginosus KNP414]|uniref:Uncharacterized protein n=1 Tax=Paenibacillus mucilaginosus (strain KNP414) TaxID=1036673 RepID=F8FM03_PAEMK|nr:hypothetical protein KNP414_07119 [Paenibacillus mucilaginosus KNP414]